MGKKVTKSAAKKVVAKAVKKIVEVENLVATVPDGWTSHLETNHPDGVPPFWTGHLGE